MQKFKTYYLILILGLLTFNRGDNFGGARLNTSLINNYNITTVNVNLSSNGTQVGQPLSQALFNKISSTLQAIAELKLRLKR